MWMYQKPLFVTQKSTTRYGTWPRTIDIPRTGTEIHVYHNPLHFCFMPTQQSSPAVLIMNNNAYQADVNSVWASFAFSCLHNLTILKQTKATVKDIFFYLIIILLLTCKYGRIDRMPEGVKFITTFRKRACVHSQELHLTKLLMHPAIFSCLFYL